MASTSASRLHWLAVQIHKGRCAFVAFSYNAVTNTEKVKFTLTDECSLNGVYRPCVMAALSAVQAATSCSVVTDKGHRSKNCSQTVVEFWLSQLPSSGSGFAGDTRHCSPVRVGRVASSGGPLTAAVSPQDAVHIAKDDATFHSSSEATPDTLPRASFNANATLAFQSAKDLLFESERLRGDLQTVINCQLSVINQKDAAVQGSIASLMPALINAPAVVSETLLPLMQAFALSYNVAPVLDDPARARDVADLPLGGGPS